MADKFLTEERKRKLDAAFDAIDFFNPNIKTTLDKIDDYNKKSLLPIASNLSSLGFNSFLVTIILIINGLKFLV